MSNKAVELIRMNGQAKSRDEAINEVAEMLISAKAVTPLYRDAMFDRESSVSTYMGNLLAIPHGTLEGVAEVLHSALAIVRYENPINWDGNEVRFVIGIAGKDGTHMDSLGMIAQVFSDLETVEELLKVSTEDQVRAIFASQAAA